MICVIPKANIRKIAVYVNSGRMTMQQVKNSLGCQYILNGGLYDMAKFAAINHLTVDGKVLSANGNPYGYGIKDGGLVFSYGNNVKAPTFLGAYPVLVRDGKASGDAAPAGLDGFRARSCVGVTRAGDVVLLCDQTGRSLNGMAGELLAAGCDTAINLDGGGSSQCDFDGKALASSRVVHNFLCIWTEDAPAETPDKKKVLLIAGHGAGDPGAAATIGGKAYREDTEARRVVSALQKRLGGLCAVYPTDRDGYQDYKKGTLRAVARFQDYGFVLEVHFNAFKAGAADGKTKGVEVYVPKGGDKTVADKLCKAVSACGLTNRGVKDGNLAVINTAKSCGVPACLLEVCFIDDPDDMAVYIAKFDAIVEAIAAAFGAPAQPQDEAEAARAWVMAQGISDGSSPDRAATRSEVWRMLYRMRKTE